MDRERRKEEILKQLGILKDRLIMDLTTALQRFWEDKARLDQEWRELEAEEAKDADRV